MNLNEKLKESVETKVKETRFDQYELITPIF